MNSAIIMILFAEMFWSSILVLIVCFLGQNVADAFEEIEDEINQLDWYRLRINMRQTMSIFINGAQQTASVEVFGSLSCDREAFKKVSLTSKPKAQNKSR